ASSMLHMSSRPGCLPEAMKDMMDPPGASALSGMASASAWNTESYMAPTAPSRLLHAAGKRGGIRLPSGSGNGMARDRPPVQGTGGRENIGGERMAERGREGDELMAPRAWRSVPVKSK